VQDVLSTVSVIIASVSVTIGVIYYFLILRGTRKREKIDMLMRLYMSYNTKEFHDADSLVLSAEFKDYDDFKAKYVPLLDKSPSTWPFERSAVPMNYSDFFYTANSLI